MPSNRTQVQQAIQMYRIVQIMELNLDKLNEQLNALVGSLSVSEFKEYCQATVPPVTGGVPNEHTP